MTRRITKRSILAAGAAALVAGVVSLHARPARAYTFIDELPEDPCARARAFEPQDGSPAALHARRACRLQVFEQRLAEERRQAVASEQDARNESAEKWLETAQPARVAHPLAIELFAGSGIVNYGAAISWNALRNIEVAARIGQRQMSCADGNFGTSADCTRTTWGAGARWIMADRDFSPFIGAAFSSTSAPLKIVMQNPQGGGDFLDGRGSANSASASAGIQLGASHVRFSLEYLYEYVFYTGANLTARNGTPDPDRTPSEDLRLVWAESLKTDRHGVRFQVGFAF